MNERVVVAIGPGGDLRQVPADEPLLRADDLGVLRGDGVFETLHVRSGHPSLLAEHLSRMVSSAARLELTLPPADDLRALATAAARAWPADQEAAMRLICTRGPEATGVPTVYATVSGIGDGILRQRRDGIRVATAGLGVASDARSEAPWLLGGVKSLSYASNMAALRWAAARGMDDVLYVSAEGHVLEGPTASVMWLTGTRLCSVPASIGILPGTTAAHLLSRAGELGLREHWEVAAVADLRNAEGVWFCSSVRGVAGFTALDGVDVPTDPRLTDRFRALLGFPS